MKKTLTWWANLSEKVKENGNSGNIKSVFFGCGTNEGNAFAKASNVLVYFHALL